MTREQFEHAVRAAGAILDTDEVLVIGSQAVDALPDQRRALVGRLLAPKQQ